MAVRQVADVLQEINSASAEQVKVSHDVGKQAEGVRSDTAQVANATKEQQTTVEEVTKTAHELAKTADNLNEQTKLFKL